MPAATAALSDSAFPILGILIEFEICFSNEGLIPLDYFPINKIPFSYWSFLNSDFRFYYAV